MVQDFFKGKEGRSTRVSRRYILFGDGKQFTDNFKTLFTEDDAKAVLEQELFGKSKTNRYGGIVTIDSDANKNFTDLGFGQSKDKGREDLLFVDPVKYSNDRNQFLKAIRRAVNMVSK